MQHLQISILCDINPSAAIMNDGNPASSADRMVGMDHAEVRYFTRYDDFYLLVERLMLIVFSLSYDHHGNFPKE